MQYTETDLVSLKQTGDTMRRLASEYATDMAPYASMTLQEVFNLVKAIPYRKDPPGQEFLMRPQYTLLRNGNGGDCDDKAIAMAAWCNLNRIPFRILAVGLQANKPLHHVLLECRIGMEWVVVDATYPQNVLGRHMGEFPARQYI
jgi:transglutaminase-like putative cysteine protease